MKTAYVLGAGFSKNANLPLQCEIAEQLLDTSLKKTRISEKLIAIIKDHLEKTYGFSGDLLDKTYSFEDIFTNIDLSANSGEYLGSSLSPKFLRSLRRILIYRVLEILDLCGANFEKVNNLLKNINIQESSFVSLNWDIVLEKSLLNVHHNYIPKYGIKEQEISGEKSSKKTKINIAKLHGSSNWVICENCKRAYYSISEKTALNRYAGLRKTDVTCFDKTIQDDNWNDLIDCGASDRKCPKCGVLLEPSIVTFSYLKSTQSRIFIESYVHAECILRSSKRWVFIGYSLPEADYVFKHLLKKCEKMHDRNIEISVVLLKDEKAKKRYENYFGKEIKFYMNGLDEYISGLTNVEPNSA